MPQGTPTRWFGANAPSARQVHQLEQDERHRQRADGDVQLPRGELANEPCANDDAHNHARQQVFEVLDLPFSPIVIERKRIARAKQRQQHTDRERRRLATRAEGQHAEWRREHPQSAAEACLGQPDEQDAHRGEKNRGPVQHRRRR
jgi:hypothetical protein